MRATLLYAEMSPELESLFWSRVDRLPGDACWLWTGPMAGPYGALKLPGTRTVGAHRMMWMLTRGAIPPRWHVCHRCDNPRCVRPDHLFLGTVGDNMADMKAKGRSRPPGPSRVRLSPRDVREIRRLARSGVLQRKIADRFGVTHFHINKIVVGRCWGSV